MATERKMMANASLFYNCFLMGILSCTTAVQGQSDEVPIISACTGISDGQFLYFFGGIKIDGSGVLLKKQTASYNPAKTLIVDPTDENQILFWVDEQETPWDDPLAFPLVHYDPWGDKMYIYGGSHSGIPQNALWMYDPALRTWHEIQKTEPWPEPLNNANLVGLDNGFVLLGGRNVQNQKNEKVWLYDLTQNLWKQYPDLPASSDYNDGVAAPLNGHEFMIWGGNGYDDGYTIWTMNVTDPVPTWKSKVSTPATLDGPMPVKTSAPAVGINRSQPRGPLHGIPNTEEIVVMGGYDNQGRDIEQIFHLAVKYMQWTRGLDPPDMKNYSATASGDRFWSYGGYVPNVGHTNDLSSYDWNSYSWKLYDPRKGNPFDNNIRIAFYVQDAWTMTGGLTLTTGIRYESETHQGYRVAKARVNGTKSGEPNWQIIQKLDKDSTSFTDTLELDGMTYLYRVCAYNVTGNSEWSEPVSIVASSTPPGIQKQMMEMRQMFDPVHPGQITLQMSSEFPGTHKLNIYSADGKLLSAEQIELSQELRIISTAPHTTYTPGIYIAVLTGQSHTMTIKIIN